MPEVVRDPRVHFYKVPRLGSYMAIRLEYNSCLFEEAFDVYSFVRELALVLRSINAAETIMDDGGFRVDVNVSVHKLKYSNKLKVSFTM